MRVKVKKISTNAKLPYKKYDSDFCYDLYATSCEEIAPNVYKYGLGLAFQIERAYEKIFQVGRYYYFCADSTFYHIHIITLFATCSELGGKESSFLCVKFNRT